MQIAVDRLVDARWTDEIYDEWIRNLVAGVPGIPIERLQITRKPWMTRCRTQRSPTTRHISRLSPCPIRMTATSSPPRSRRRVGYPHLESARFPCTGIEEVRPRRQTPDVFLVDLYDKIPDQTVASFANARRNFSKTRVSASDFIDILNNQKLTQLSNRVAGTRRSLSVHCNPLRR